MKRWWKVEVERFSKEEKKNKLRREVGEETKEIVTHRKRMKRRGRDIEESVLPSGQFN